MAETLQEYLIKLGYKVDEVSSKKMEDGLGTMGKKIYGVGSAVTGMVASVAVATTAFAYRMRKMYFESELSKTTVGNMQSLAYAGEQIGVSGESMQSVISSLGQIFRLNPGMVQYASALTGISEAGRDTSDVMIDLVKATSKMDEFAGARVMANFGMDADTYHQMRNHIDELIQKQNEYKQQQAALGIDAQENAKIMTQYAGSIDKIKASFQNAVQAAASTMLPAMQYASNATTHLLDDITKFIGQLSSDKLSNAILTGDFSGLGKATKDLLLGSEQTSAAAKTSLPGENENNAMFNQLLSSRANARMMFSQLENKYGLPAGLLDSMWKQESGRGMNLRSKAGATGHFQFKPKTAKEFGLNEADTFNLEKSAGAAAKYMSQLIAHYGGDVPSALAAYNWGQKNVDTKGLGAAPAETQAYVPSILGRLGTGNVGASGMQVAANQTNNITIYSNDKDVGKSVAKETSRVWQDINRNFRPAVS